MVDMARFSDAPGAPPFEDTDPPQAPDAAWARVLAQALDPGAPAAEGLLPAEEGGTDGDLHQDVVDPWAADGDDVLDVPDPSGDASEPPDATDDPADRWDDDSW